jgi:hypothetical protein
VKHRSRNHTNRRLTAADERALDRRIAEATRRYREQQDADDRAVTAWVQAQRALMTPQEQAEADARFAERSRLEDERRARAERDREAKRNDPYSTFGT